MMELQNRGSVPANPKPGQYQTIEFRVPATAAPRVQYNVSASEAISVLLLDRANLALFSRNKPFRYYGKRRRRWHDEDVAVDAPGQWSLVIWNEATEIAAIDYEIWVPRGR